MSDSHECIMSHNILKLLTQWHVPNLKIFESFEIHKSHLLPVRQKQNKFIVVLFSCARHKPIVTILTTALIIIKICIIQVIIVIFAICILRIIISHLDMYLMSILQPFVSLYNYNEHVIIDLTHLITYTYITSLTSLIQSVQFSSMSYDM